MKRKTISANASGVLEYGWVIEIVKEYEQLDAREYISDISPTQNDHIGTTKNIEDALWLAREEDIRAFISIVHSIATSLKIRGIKVYRSNSTEGSTGICETDSYVSTVIQDNFSPKTMTGEPNLLKFTKNDNLPLEFKKAAVSPVDLAKLRLDRAISKAIEEFMSLRESLTPVLKTILSPEEPSFGVGYADPESKDAGAPLVKDLNSYARTVEDLTSRIHITNDELTL